MKATRPRISFQRILSELRKRDFAVLSTVDDRGRPHSVGVVYGVSRRGLEIYVMTRKHLEKARNIARNPNVTMVVPLPRKVLWFMPPPCIQFHGRAEIVDRHDSGGTETFKTFFMGRRILAMYEDLERREDNRTCFLRITLEPVVSTYMVGHSIWELRRRMEVGTEQVAVPAEYRPFEKPSSNRQASSGQRPI
jgi:nitroimidazol reductase NimA-like FMN-containing flavoprotein (pyridoxamine 5'-phosphate oxidase superfamily)